MSVRVVGVAAIAGVVLAIAAFAFFTQAAKPAPARLAHYAISSDGRELTVTAALGSLEKIESRRIEESPTSVKVIVLSRRGSGTGTLNILLVDLPFTLAEPLGDRKVVDADGALIPLAR